MNDKFGKIVDRREMLRVKVKSLAAEARIIRLEEHRTKGALRDELRNHRVGIVRYEARHAHLAYGLIRGRTVERIEGNAKTEPNWAKVKTMIKKYGPKDYVFEGKLADEPPKQSVVDKLKKLIAA